MALDSIRAKQTAAGLDALNTITARGRNPNYMARIVYQTSETEEGAAGDTGVLSLSLPENFQLNFEGSYDQPFAQGLVQAPGVNQALKFFGASLTSQSMSVQVWQGTTCPTFNLTFQLYADTDAETDVVQPIRLLSKLALPGVNAARLLSPPGPRIDPVVAGKAAAAVIKASTTGLLSTAASAVVGVATMDFTSVVGNARSAAAEVGNALDSILDNPANNIVLYIGRFLVLPSVVIQSVSQTYDTLFDERGRPIKANVDVTFSTWYVPVKSDVSRMFGGS